MIVLDANVVSELMKSTPEPAVMVWINALPGATVFLSAVTQAEILYGVALVPEGKRRDGLARAAGSVFETYFRGRILPFDSEAAEAFATLAAARLACRFRRRTFRLPRSRGQVVRRSLPTTCRILRGAGSRSSIHGVRHADT
jgi:predicted nucleic acid-binding protein